ncbi:hypothetical protein BBK82_07975 [Lentzea guizhouensis]|uniref:AAA+ ATPase domain-containing protein n=1 Tax=Lentzea guizhouensis TaxID=1586287 RepID=A0A1B2HE53_9PSEU|nr:hypothetical protein BBK82_07975 [Lentzea guizhouensis]
MSAWLDGESPRVVGAPVALTTPLDSGELADLRWYLEDYLRVPFGIYEQRGLRIAERLPEWGQAMFAALFGQGPGREAYLAVRTRDTAAELVVRSTDPSWLSLPWELLHDPAVPAPFALDGMVVSRALSTGHVDGTFGAGGQRLRVLMVISRPDGDRDVGYQMIARPLLRRLSAVRGQVEVEVLRPPTREALTERLRATGADPYQIVHFDGHGSTSDRGASLVFERAGGGVEHVPAAEFAHVLTEAGIPVVVLNACRSGAVGDQVEATIAAGLLSGGTDAVVAMAYTVHADAAAEFMTAFYQRLFAGDTVGEAVRAGRVRMAAHPQRRSPKGAQPLADWIVPVCYRRREVHFPYLRPVPGAQAGREQQPEQGDLWAPDGELVGRDGLICTLETVARKGRVVVLHGPAGTGKTALAKAFGRWWRDTDGVDRPEWVLWHSFEPGVATYGLDGVISTIGLSVFGPGFAAQDRAAQRERVRTLLADNRLLVVWDNFESVASLPDPAGATPPLDETGRAELREFLHEAATGRSTILLTSRTQEDWLGGVQRVAVGRLTPDDAVQYADHLLAPLPSAVARRADRAFGELLIWLNGHPLSMRLVLPHLETSEAADLLSALRGAAALPEDRLLAGIAYSMSHLDPDGQRLLAAVCLFQGTVSASLLGIVFADDDAPHRFRHVPSNRWEEVLHQAAHIGLLTAAGDGWYGIHPVLPAYLAGQWRAEDPDEFAAAERFLVDAFLAVGAQMGEMTRSIDAAKAYRLIGVLRRTMGHLLSYALDHGLWLPALAILQPLREYWDRRWMVEESRAWDDRVLRAVESEDGFPGPLDKSADRLWLSVISAEAQRLTRARLLDAAEAMCVRARDRILAHSLDRAGLTTLCHRLGEIAAARARWDDAENWHSESLALEEELDDRAGIAWSHRALGDVAKARGQWNKARGRYLKSRKLKDELGDRRGAALACSALGTLAEIRKHWDEAQNWHREVRDISEELGDDDGQGRAMHQLGAVAQRLGQFDAAEVWYHMSLEVSERMGDPLARAASYVELGRLALHRDRVDEAEQWVHQHRAIVEPLGVRRQMAVSYQMLGGVALKRGHGDAAVCWLGKAIAAFEDVGDQHNVAGSHHVLSEVWKQRGQRTEAERCLHEALAVEERLGDRTAVAASYGELGRLAADFGDVDVALDWTFQSLAIVEPPSRIIVSHYVLAHVVARLGLEEVERRWIRATDVPLPAAIRTFVEGREPRRTDDN